MAKSSIPKKKKIEIRYIAKTKRMYGGRLFPNKDPKKNTIEIYESDLESFLKTKVGGDRLWTTEKEKIKKEEVIN